MARIMVRLLVFGCGLSSRVTTGAVRRTIFHHCPQLMTAQHQKQTHANRFQMQRLITTVAGNCFLTEPQKLRLALSATVTTSTATGYGHGKLPSHKLQRRAVHLSDCPI